MVSAATLRLAGPEPGNGPRDRRPKEITLTVATYGAPKEMMKTRADFVDLVYLWRAAQALQEHGIQRIEIPRLRAALDKVRERLKWPVAEARYAFGTVDPENERQARFLRVLEESGFSPVCVLPSRSYVTTFFGEAAEKERPVSTVGPFISCALGMLAERSAGSTRTSPKVHAVVFTGNFEAWFAADVVRKRGGQVALAAFGSLIDRRWFTQGGARPLADAGSPIPGTLPFIDIENSLAPSGNGSGKNETAVPTSFDL